LGFPRLAILFIALMTSAPMAMAVEVPAKSDFDAGVKAFRQGNLEEARIFFERARAAGTNSPSLLYNLGVVYFRLGDLESAETVFLTLLETPHAPLAYYNLGLVKQRMGKIGDARRWFERAASPDSPEEVQTLARQQLADVTAQPSSNQRHGSGYLSVAGGYDDNISGTPDDVSSDKEGGFADALAAGSVQLGMKEISLHGVAFTRQYPGNSAFDNTYLSTGASLPKELGDGELISTLSLSASWFGGDPLEREARVEMLYHPDRCVLAPVVSGVECSVSGSVSTIDGGSDYSAYDGEMLRFRASADKALGSWVLSGHYQLEDNHRRDLSTQQEFFSVSPIRNLVSAEVRHYVSSRFSFGGKADVRYSRYKDDQRFVSNGTLVSERRTDNRLRGSLLAEYRLAGEWMMLAEWSMLDNRSTIDRYDYSRREVMLGFETVF